MDVDIIVEDSLNKLWNTDINNYYIAGVKELWDYYNKHSYKNLQNDNPINAGVLIINVEKWI